MSIKISLTGGKKVEANINGFTVKTDQPIQSGGENSAPSPFELFLASMATCQGFYVSAFCSSRDIPSEEITLAMDYEVNQEKHMIGKIITKITVPDSFPVKYHKALIKSAESCTVKKHLSADIETIVTIG